MSECKKCSLKSHVNHLVTNDVTSGLVSNTGEQKTKSGDQWHGIVSRK